MPAMIAPLPRRAFVTVSPSRAARASILLIAASVAPFAALSASAATPERACVVATDATATELSQRFVAALQTRHPDRVTRLYGNDGALQGFASPVSRGDYASIREYYLYFLQFDPQLKFEERQIELGCNFLVDSGNYTWSLKTADQFLPQTIPGRYRIVYEHNGTDWQIAEHLEELTLANADETAFNVPDPQPPRAPVTASGKGPAVAGFLKRSDDDTSVAKSAVESKRVDPSVDVLPQAASPQVSKLDKSQMSRLGLKHRNLQLKKTKPTDGASSNAWQDDLWRSPHQ